MAYQRTTKAQGFRQRVVPQTENKNYTDLAKSLEKERKQGVTDFTVASNQQITEMKRISGLEDKKDIYELGNLRSFSKSLNTALKSGAENILKPMAEGQIEKGITTAIRCQQGDQEACEVIRINDDQETEIQKQISEQRIKVEQATENIKKEWDEAGFEADLRQKYRLLNLKKQNSNFATGYRRGMLMEAATGYDAWRDSILTGSSEDPIKDREIEHEGELYKVSEYYATQNTEVKQKIVGALQGEYIKRHGVGLNEYMVQKYLTNKVTERTNLFNQNEFNKTQRDWANTTIEYHKKQFEEILFTDLTTEKGLQEADNGIQEWLANGPSVMEALGVEGPRNAASKKKLIEYLVGTLKSERFANVDDSNQLFSYLESKRFYIPGLSKQVGFEEDGSIKYEKQSLSELLGSEFDTKNLRAEVLEDIYKKEAQKIEGSKLKLKKDIEAVFKNAGNDTVAFELGMAELYQMPEYHGKYWANSIFKQHDSTFKLIPKLDEKESRKIMRELEREYDVKNGGKISILNVNTQRIDINVLKEYNDKGLLSDPYNGSLEAKKIHEGGVTTLENLVKGIFEKKNLPEEIETLQTQAFISWVSPKIIAAANDHMKITGASFEDSLKYSVAYYKQKLQADNSAVFGEIEQPAASHSDKDNISLNVGKQGFSEQIYKNNVLGLSTTSFLSENYLDTIQKANNAASNNKGYIFKNNLIVKNDAFYQLVDGRPGKMFEALSKVDPLTTHPAVIYNDQIVQMYGKEAAIEWSPEIQLEIEQWMALSKDARKALVSNEDIKFNTALKKEGFISLSDLTQTLITPDGSIPVNETEFASLLIRAGVEETFTYQEFLARPDLVEKAVKKKMMEGLALIQPLTNNRNETIRRLTAYMITNDHENWNQGNFKNYTLETLNAYHSGNKERLNSIFHNKGLSLNSFNVDVPYARDLIDTTPDHVLKIDLNTVNSVADLEEVLSRFNELDVPEQKINIREKELWEDGAGVISHQFRRILGLGWERMPNAEYERYIEFKGNLEDKLMIMRVLESAEKRNALSSVKDFLGDTALRIHFLDPSKELEWAFLPAVKDIIGEERLNTIIEKAKTKYDKDGTGRYDDVLFELLRNEPEFNAVEEGNKEEGDGNTEAGFFTPDTPESIQNELNLNKAEALGEQMLDIIHSGESTVDVIGNGYEAINQGGADDGKKVLGFSGTYGNHPANKGKKLVDLTINEILAIQDSAYDTSKYSWDEKGWKKWFASGGFHAVGRYQFTREGLRDALILADIDPNEKFTPAIQDRLGLALLIARGPDWWVSMKGNKELPKLIEKYNKVWAQVE